MNRLGHRTRTTLAVAGLGLSALFASCGGDAEALSRDELIVALADGAGLEATDAECIIDTALETRSAEELTEIGRNGDVSDELEAEVIEITTDCLMASAGLSLPDTDTDNNNNDNDNDNTDTDNNPFEPVSTPIEPDTSPEDPGPDLTPEPVDPTPVPDPTPAPVETVDLAAFCAASTEFAVVAVGADYVPDEPRYIELVFTELDPLLDRAITAAPTADYAVAPQAFNTSFDIVAAEMAAKNYSPENFDTSGADAWLEEHFDTMADVLDSLYGFLETDCGVDRDVLDADAQAWADSRIDSVPNPMVEISDKTGRISVTVPRAWSDVIGTPDGITAELIASPNVATFVSSWNIDGIRIRSTEVEGVANAPRLIETTDAFNDCLVDEIETYDDGLYTGMIANFTDCGESTEAVVIAANTSTLDTEILVEVQFQNGIDEDIMQEIIATFMAS